MSTGQTIKQMQASDRPRERFLKQGAASLRTAEVMAVLLGSGLPGENIVQVAQRVLDACGGRLTNLQNMTHSQLCAFRGIGEVKALCLMAAAELARRRSLEKLDDLQQITSSKDIHSIFAEVNARLPHEEMWALYLNHSNRMLGREMISHGGITQTLVDVRIIIKGALLRDATAIALCHNHPSGNVKPSREDNSLTAQLQQACNTMNIRLIDHIIVADAEQYYSYHDEGII